MRDIPLTWLGIVSLSGEMRHKLCTDKGYINHSDYHAPMADFDRHGEPPTTMMYRFGGTYLMAKLSPPTIRAAFRLLTQSHI